VYVIGIVSLVITIGAIVVGATESGNTCIDMPVLVSLATWAIVWGSIATAAVLLAILEVAVRPNAFLSFFKWLMVVFLTLPWLIIGTVLLLLPREQCAGILVFWTVTPLVVTYLYITTVMYVMKVRSDDSVRFEESTEAAVEAREIYNASNAALKYRSATRPLAT
jgi:hypothetical protein